MKPTTALLAACTFLVSGCVSFSGLSPTSNYADFGDNSIIVLGVTRPAGIHIYKGDQVGDSWLRDNLTVTLNTSPVDGYIVANMAPRSGSKLYGIGTIIPGWDGNFGMLGPCQNDRAMTFQAPAGKVVYVGDLELDRNAGIRFTAANIEKARAHLKVRFPLLANRLVQQGFAELKTNYGSATRNLTCNNKPMSPG